MDGARGRAIWRTLFRTADSINSSDGSKAKKRSRRCIVILGCVQASARKIARDRALAGIRIKYSISTFYAT